MAKKCMIHSAGTKHGQPPRSDVMIDCRHLPNPHDDPKLRDLTGLDEAVRQKVLGGQGAVNVVTAIVWLVKLEAIRSVTFYCVGGRHRSVVLAEYLAYRLRGHGLPCDVQHRDLKEIVS